MIKADDENFYYIQDKISFCLICQSKYLINYGVVMTIFTPNKPKPFLKGNNTTNNSTKWDLAQSFRLNQIQ